MLYLIYVFARSFFIKSWSTDYSSCDMKPSSSAFKVLCSWYKFFIFCSSCWAVDGLLLGFFTS